MTDKLTKKQQKKLFDAQIKKARAKFHKRHNIEDKSL